MSRILVNAPSGRQEVIEIVLGGGYFDTLRVLWDERVDGAMPEITLGGMVRSGASLAFSQTRMDEHIAAGKLKNKADLMRQITMLERDSMLNRGSRELEIINMQDIAARKAEKFKAENPADPRTNEQLAAEYLAATPYYAKLTALDAQIAILRGQLGA